MDRYRPHDELKFKILKIKILRDFNNLPDGAYHDRKGPRNKKTRRQKGWTSLDPEPCRHRRAAKILEETR